MSRPGEIHDFDQPPGLSSYRSSAVLVEGQPNGNHVSQDRRQSQFINSQSLYAANPSRSFALQDRDFALNVNLADLPLGPNRHNPPSSKLQSSAQSFSSLNHNNVRPSPPLPQSTQSTLYNSNLNDRDHAVRSIHSSNPSLSTPAPANSNAARSTLLWGNIEPWMDEEYARQVCTLMGWDPVNVKVPHPPPDPATGQQANNPGYCFLTFPSPAHAASVLAQINNGGNGPPITMPNSNKPFVLNWATSVPAPNPLANTLPSNSNPLVSVQQPPHQYQKEYSIFVGDLAPETSNSDLVAVFRNPVLGLRNDREPKFIRPFLSCKSAKIMLDPVTGVSRGYGFVRFTDEADQQRALIEMHGLYCLSRPMRISPATAKYKPPPLPSPLDIPSQLHFPNNSLDQQQPVTIALPLPNTNQTKSVSTPIASTNSSSSLATAGVPTSGSGSSIGGSNSSGSVNSTTASSSSAPSSLLGSVTSEDIVNLPQSVLAQIAQQVANGEISASRLGAGNYGNAMNADAQVRQQTNLARAILGNLIGPNGEQLTSTDPYNTTVFVGGLSPLISEETLRTFFAPFGDIHYVKVPVGKHCGFVQFVRKADAERAIEKMQGFPIGGSRIRLSWGRSQYKAAQAAAQAAQAAALQAQYNSGPTPLGAMSQEQALQLLQKFAMSSYVGASGMNAGASAGLSSGISRNTDAGPTPYDFSSNPFIVRQDNHPFPQESQRPQPVFSPFSPDPATQGSDADHRQPVAASRSESLPQLSKGFASTFYPNQSTDLKLNNANASGNLNRVSPTSTRPPSATRYGSYLEPSNSSFQVGRRPESSISRPSSGSTGRNDRDNTQDLDTLQDLNGTLASLDLDRDNRPWRSPTEGTTAISQFRTTTETSP
ncbi:hypothetical protein AX16_007762 [Volvariella volvacea WC 439]|nr:hypothetical protein AX16_007762 [Volvariella volvacea WC 439]